MTLYEKIRQLYPELTEADFSLSSGTILLQNDSNNTGDYIKIWNHSIYPCPTKEQLNGV